MPEQAGPSPSGEGLGWGSTAYAMPAIWVRRAACTHLTRRVARSDRAGRFLAEPGRDLGALNASLRALSGAYGQAARAAASARGVIGE